MILPCNLYLNWYNLSGYCLFISFSGYLRIDIFSSLSLTEWSGTSQLQGWQTVWPVSFVGCAGLSTSLHLYPVTLTGAVCALLYAVILLNRNSGLHSSSCSWIYDNNWNWKVEVVLQWKCASHVLEFTALHSEPGFFSPETNWFLNTEAFQCIHLPQFICINMTNLNSNHLQPFTLLMVINS